MSIFEIVLLGAVLLNTVVLLTLLMGLASIRDILEAINRGVWADTDKKDVRMD